MWLTIDCLIDLLTKRRAYQINLKLKFCFVKDIYNLDWMFQNIFQTIMKHSFLYEIYCECFNELITKTVSILQQHFSDKWSKLRSHITLVTNIQPFPKWSICILQSMGGVRARACTGFWNAMFSNWLLTSMNKVTEFK